MKEVARLLSGSFCLGKRKCNHRISVRKAQIALYWPPRHSNSIPPRYFLARDEALDYRNADLLVIAFDLFFCITENKSALFFGI